VFNRISYKKETDMLKGIPSILTPELLKTLMEMGHGDELLLADGNYPRAGHPERVIRCDGHAIPQLLDAIMQFMPLDTYVENPTIFMAVVDGDKNMAPHNNRKTYEPTIWGEYRKIVARHEKTGARDTALERYAFYARARDAYAVVTTGERALYANVILKKGVI
jgi:L-fucose mutarotase